MNMQEPLLKAIFAMVARIALPPEALNTIVATIAGRANKVLACNFCDGETLKSEIGKKANLDPASLGRSIAKLVETDVMIRVGPEQLPLHAYPLTKASATSANKTG